MKMISDIFYQTHINKIVCIFDFRDKHVFFLELRNCQNIACLNNYIVRFYKTCIFVGIRIYINIRSLLMELDG